MADLPRRPVVAMLLYPGLTPLDLVAPHAALALHADVHLVWKTRDPVTSDVGLQMLPTTPLGGCAVGAGRLNLTVWHSPSVYPLLSPVQPELVATVRNLRSTTMSRRAWPSPRQRTQMNLSDRAMHSAAAAASHE